MDKESKLELIENELVVIRRLLVFALMRTGVSQNEIAGALDLNQSSISRMFAGKKTAKRSKRKR